MSSWKCLTGVLVCAMILGAAPATEPVTQTLERAIYNEETAGNLDAAMALYQQIADQAQASRPAVAEAIFRLGAC